MNRNEIIHLIIDKVPLVLLAFVVIFGFRGVATMHTSTAAEEFFVSSDWRFGIYSLFGYYYQYNVNNGGTLALIVFAFICSLLILSIIILSLRKNNTKTKIIYYSTALVLSILVGVFSHVAMNNIMNALKASDAKSGFGGANIVNIVMFAVSLILTYVNSKFEKKEVVAEKKSIKTSK